VSRTLLKYLLVPALFLLAAGQDAFAQSYPPANLTPVVPSGMQRQLGFAAALNADCSSAGDIEARLVKPPKHGTVEIEHGAGYTFYPEKNQRYGCNQRLTQGVRISYTSEEKFTGKDPFEVELFGPFGVNVVWKYSVTVK
jgi:hypothetical protein